MCWPRILVFFFKQKTAYEMRISDWSSDVCSSDLGDANRGTRRQYQRAIDPGELFVGQAQTVRHRGIKVRGAHGEAIHRRVIEAGQVDCRDDRDRKRVV